MRVLVTGVSGFAGSHLAEYLLAEGHQVFGFTDDPSLDDNLADIAGRITVFQGDIRRRERLRDVLAQAEPERIYHLAAITPGRGGGEDCSFWEVNVGGTAALLDEAGRLPRTRVHVAGSSAEYGLLPMESNPVTEKAELRPVGVYAVSKVAQDLLAFSYWAHQGLWVVRTRAFNHSGPREDSGFACSTFARQVARAEAEPGEGVIRVGNLDAHRDISDVRDVVRGYVAALERGRAGSVYNVCSGAAVQIRQVLETLMRMSKVPLRVELDTDRLRPSDLPYQQGDGTAIANDAGWKPSIPLEQTLQDLLDYWRRRVREGRA
jgi:GDP-4-dehydro-6-deoxy-D-mannose reductase